MVHENHDVGKRSTIVRFLTPTVVEFTANKCEDTMEAILSPIRLVGVWAYELEPRHYTMAALLLIVLFICVRVTTFVAQAIYNVFFNPLRKFPGPVTAGFSELWQLYHQIKCKLILDSKQQWARQLIASDQNLNTTDKASVFWNFS